MERLRDKGHWPHFHALRRPFHRNKHGLRGESSRDAMAVGDNFHLFILFFLTLAPWLRSSVSHQDLPRGHGQQLGKHRESDGHVDVIDSSELPSP